MDEKWYVWHAIEEHPLRGTKVETLPTLAAAEIRALELATDGDVWAIGVPAGFDDNGWMKLRILALALNETIYTPKDNKE